MEQLTQWSQVAVILAGYVLGGYLQKRHIDDFRNSINRRFDELDALFSRRFDDMNKRFDE